VSLLRRIPGSIAFSFLCLAGLVAACSAQSSVDTPPSANPARPTVSTPATLTPLGYLQFETGTQYATDSIEFSSRLGFNQVTKLTVHPRLQLILLSEPLVDSTIEQLQTQQSGGVSIGAQGVLLLGNDRRPTISVSYIRSVYSGPAPDIDIGSATQSAILLVSHDLFGFHVDANGIVNQQEDGALRKAQWGQTLSISHPIGKFTLAGEIWHFSQPLVHGNTVGNLWALSYSVRPNLVLDAGFNRGFNITSTRWELFCGFTYLLPHRLWKAAPPVH
jgi:hypothetical protein